MSIGVRCADVPEYIKQVLLPIFESLTTAARAADGWRAQNFGKLGCAIVCLSLEFHHSLGSDTVSSTDNAATTSNLTSVFNSLVETGQVAFAVSV